MTTADSNPVAVARASYRACIENDRAGFEALLAEDCRFSSPGGAGVGRKAYLARRWPEDRRVASLDFIHFVQDGERVTVAYEGRSPAGKRLRNIEVLSVREGRIVAVEAAFPWRGARHGGRGGKR